MRQRADGKLLAIARPFTGTQLGGDILLIDAAQFVEINQPSSPDGHGQGTRAELGDLPGRDHGFEPALGRRTLLFHVPAL